MQKKMGIKSFSCLTVLSMIFISCTIPHMKLPDTLNSNGEQFAVSGRQGLVFNRKLRFGEYYTEKIKQGWQKGKGSESQISLFFFDKVDKKEESKQKTSFSLKDSKGNRSKVNLVSRINLNVDEIEPFFNFFPDWKTTYQSILVNNDVYCGDMYINDSVTWNFFLINPHDINESNAESAANCGAKEIKIRKVRGVDVKGAEWDKSLSGYEFIMNNTTIGAVEILNNGIVWMDKSVSSEDKFIIANIATAILIRIDLFDEDAPE